MQMPNPEQEDTDPGRRVPHTLKLKRSVPLRFSAAMMATAVVVADAAMLPHLGGSRIDPGVLNLLLCLWGAFVAGDTWRPTGTLKAPLL